MLALGRGRGTVFALGKQTVNEIFENENFELILFSEFQNFGGFPCFPGSAATANVLPVLPTVKKTVW